MLELCDLKKLAARPAAGRAYLSVYLSGPHCVDGLTKKLDKIRHVLKSGGAQKDEREYFDDNVCLVTEYLNRCPLHAGSLCIFSCHALEVFETIPLAAHVPDLIRVDFLPFIRPLAELCAGHTTAAVVVADNRKARIFVVSLAETGSREVIRGNVKNHVKVGGWSQQRYERRRDNELHKYALEIVDALARISTEEEINHILLAGGKETLRAVHENMPHKLRDKVVEKAVDLSKGDSAINRDIMDLFHEEELAAGLQHWEKIRAEYLRGGLAVVGPEDVLGMAGAKRIEHAVIDRTLQLSGMRCRNCHNLHIGGVSSCLVCSSRSLFAADVINAILDMLYQAGGTVHFTEPIPTLTAAGCIAAQLRY